MKKRGRKHLLQPVDSQAGFALKKPKKQHFTKLKNWSKGHKKLALVAALIILTVILAGGTLLLKASQKRQALTGPAASYAKQLPALSATVQDKPNDPAARKNYAVALYATKDLKGAKTQYEAAAKLSDKDATIYNNLGNVYRDLGELDKSIESYRKAIELDPTAINPYVNLANVQLYSQNKPDDAIATYTAALDNVTNKDQIELLLGIAYEQKGDFESAKATYQAILARDPGNAAAKANLERLNKQ